MFTLDYKFQEDATAEMLSANVGQVILPTGTGKSKIQARYLNEKIALNSGFAVYVIVTPRILLTNQLMRDVGTELLKTKTEFKRITVHSGKETNFTELSIEERKLLSAFDGAITTSSKELRDEVKKAQRQDVPVLICSTYHSVDRVALALKGYCSVEALLCDESQYVASEDFNDAVAKVKAISNNTFFFTATQKNTASNDGLGHNNVNFYGPVLFTKTPREMIDGGYIVRPRMHLVESAGDSDQVVSVLIDAYKQHKGTINGEPKLLVVCKGSAQLGEIVNSEEFKRFVRQQGSNFKLFDASSEFGFNVNYAGIKREQFLDQLNSHTGAAIVLHINMLAEGINVPDMSGVLPLINLKKSKFLQTLGRTTRLHPLDRTAFTNGDYLPQELKHMLKPYAYVIVPTFTNEGEDRKAFIHELITALRDHGFDPAEDIVIRKLKGVAKVEPIDLTTAPDKKATGGMFNMLFDIHHELEDERVAALLSSPEIENVYAGILDGIA
jgi:superfamily II DNA or RNA helicase